jgi:hypothetical protein
MEKKAFYIFVIVTLVAFFWISPAASQVSKIANMESFYRAHIDELISKCESKVLWRNSRFEKIRQTAALACLKASFFKHRKEELIAGMIKENIGIKQYKVGHYLNSKFFRVLRDVIKFVSTNDPKRIS